MAHHPSSKSEIRSPQEVYSDEESLAPVCNGVQTPQQPPTVPPASIVQAEAERRAATDKFAAWDEAWAMERRPPRRIVSSGYLAPPTTPTFAATNCHTLQGLMAQSQYGPTKAALLGRLRACAVEDQKRLSSLAKAFAWEQSCGLACAQHIKEMLEDLPLPIPYKLTHEVLRAVQLSEFLLEVRRCVVHMGKLESQAENHWRLLSSEYIALNLELLGTSTPMVPGNPTACSGHSNSQRPGSCVNAAQIPQRMPAELLVRFRAINRTISAKEDEHALGSPYRITVDGCSVITRGDPIVFPRTLQGLPGLAPLIRSPGIPRFPDI